MVDSLELEFVGVMTVSRWLLGLLLEQEVLLTAEP